MSYFILMGRRIPKQAITGFKFQNETDNIRPFLSIRIRGKDEIIPFKDKKEIQSVKAHLCSVFSGFVKIGDCIQDGYLSVKDKPFPCFKENRRMNKLRRKFERL